MPKLLKLLSSHLNTEIVIDSKLLSCYLELEKLLSFWPCYEFFQFVSRKTFFLAKMCYIIVP